MKYSNILDINKINNVEFINLLSKIVLPEDKTSDLYEKYIVPITLPWPLLSYKIYKDVNLYWLLMAVDYKVVNNPFIVESGTVLHIIKPEYVDLVIKSIENEL